jgi:hypothetical protein
MMAKKTYISVVTDLIKQGKSEKDMCDILKQEFPEKTDKVLRGRLKPAIKYITSKVPKQKADGIPVVE